MLIGSAANRSSIETIRRIKETLRQALELPDEATITLSELACLEEGCAPIETVFGLLRPDAPQCQHKVHKRADAIDADDLVQVCKSWGFEVQSNAFMPFAKES